MDIGVTVGDSTDRIESCDEWFDFVEYGLGESASIPDEIDVGRLQTALNENDLLLDVHLPFKQVVATPVEEINEAIVAYLERLLAWAGNSGARKAVLHGTVRNPYDVDQRELVANQLRDIIAAGQQHDVEVVVENVGHQQYGLQLSVLGDIARETNTSVCFDIGHAYMEDGQDGVDRFLKRYGDLISHLHLHDVRRRGDTHLPIGAGEVDYSTLESTLKGFAGTAAIEVFSDDRTLLRDSAERVERLFNE